MLAYYSYATHPLLIVLIVILLIGAFPRWGYNRSWGYQPLGLIVLVLILLLLLGCETSNGHRQLSPVGKTAESLGIAAAQAAATYYGGAEAGALASAGLHAVASVLEGYVGGQVPTAVLASSPGVVGVAPVVIRYVEAKGYVSPKLITEIHNAATIAANLSNVQPAPSPARP